MKIQFLLLCAIALAACGPTPPNTTDAANTPGAGATHDPARSGARVGQWARAESVRNDRPIAWEYRDDFSDSARAALPRLLVVSQLIQDDLYNMPEASKRAALEQREDLLLKALAGKAELVAVLDWNRQHDWYFYTASDDIAQQTRAALGDAVGQEIQFNLEPDPNGEFYTLLKKRVAGN